MRRRLLLFGVLVLVVGSLGAVVAVRLLLASGDAPHSDVLEVESAPVVADAGRRETVFPFKGFDFRRGRWVAYLMIHPSELPEDDDLRLQPCMMLDDPEKLARLQSLEFVVTGGDMGTPETSAFALVQDGQTVLYNGVMLNTDPLVEGIQFRSYGHIQALVPGSLMSVLKEFRPMSEHVVELPASRDGAPPVQRRCK